MFFDGDPARKGSCAATGPHISKGFNFDLPHDVPETPNAQAHWRFCVQCMAMFFNGFPDRKGACPATGGPHVARGFMFVLPHDIPETPTDQGAWRSCGNCMALFFDGDPANKGACDADLPRGHAAAGLVFVLPHHDKVQVFDDDPATID